MERLSSLAHTVFGDYGSVRFVLLWALIKVVFFVLAVAMPVASILTWLERRQSAMMQDRLGPNRANVPFLWNWKAWGITHFVADALKFISKEDFTPPKAHKALFGLAPIMAMAPPLIVAAIIPFGAPLCWGGFLEPTPSGGCTEAIPLQIAQLDTGVLFYFAVSSLAVFGATLAGWASHNKWAMMGGLRASSQMMSYEVTMGMAVLSMFLAFGTLEPGAMIDKQGAWPWQWGIVHWGVSWKSLPLLISFVLFLTAAIAETKRTPFDIPEGEPEIIGYFVEYSGMRFGMFFLGEFLEIVLSSGLMLSIFFGGWHFPGMDFLRERLPNVAFVGVTWLAWMAKIFLFCSFQLLIRWSLPRFRSDQLMQLGWQRLLPLSIANVVLAAILILTLS